MRDAAIREQIESVEALPTLPAVVLRILEVSQDEEATTDSVARVIESDQALTAQILRVVNSSAYNFSTEITTVPRAVAALGLNTLRWIALGMGVTRVFDLQTAPPGFDMKAFWRHSLACAVGARLLAESSSHSLDRDEAFVAALLHNLGQPLLAMCLPERYSEVLAKQKESGQHLLEVEEVVLGVNHAEAGKWLAERWGLPDMFVQAIWLHHQPPGALSGDTFQGPLVYAVQAAGVLASELMYGSSGSDQTPPLGDELLAEIAVEQEQVEAIQENLLARLRDYAPFINLDCDEQDIYVNALRKANHELTRMGLRLERELHGLHRREKRFRTLHRMNTLLAPDQQSLPELVSTLAVSLRDGFSVRSGICFMPMGEGAGSAWGKCWSDGGVPRDFSFPPAGEASAPGEGAPDDALLSTVREALHRGRERGGSAFDFPRHKDIYALPMISGSRVLGHLVLDYRADPPASTEDLGMDELLAFASAGAMALSRFVVQEKLKRRSEELAGAMWKKEQAQKQLLHSERLAAVGEMAAGAAHEVNNPLAIISGRAQMLVQKVADPAAQKHLQLIVDQSARASKILNDLMRFARPSMPQKGLVSVNALVAEVVEMFENQYRSHGIALHREYGEGLPRIMVDAKQVQQVLVNMLINADHAITPPGDVTVRTWWNKNTQMVAIEIADSGCGIPTAQQSKIFEPFFTTKEEGKGTGLGLSMAHGIITGHKGTIQVKSAEGQGASFTISLPVAEDVPGGMRAPRDDAPAAPPREVKRERKRVLVVDDEEQVRAVISDALDDAGYDVVQAENGALALELARRDKPDLITLDIRMPRMDGMAMLRAVREWGPELPVIVITGLAMDEEIAQAKELGVCAFIRKPFEVSQLLSEVQEALTVAS